MGAIFLSYRRNDTEGQAGRLYDDRVEAFGTDAVFMDVVGIEAGRDFRKAIDQHGWRCDGPPPDRPAARPRTRAPKS